MATEAMGAEPEVALADMLTIKIRADVVCNPVAAYRRVGHVSALNC